MKYKTIYADPPWPEYGSGQIKRGANNHYSLMTLEEIASLNVSKYADDNSHLYLWVTNNYLSAGLKTVESWGFRYINLITWAKNRIGLGQYFRNQTEHCLFGVRGRLPFKMKIDGSRIQGRTLLLTDSFFEFERCHSQKPPQMRVMIENISYAPRLELFARSTIKGWDVWGNEVDGVRLDLSTKNGVRIDFDPANKAIDNV
jgi:N6-adenosine-specific RNA methylase IME4